MMKWSIDCNRNGDGNWIKWKTIDKVILNEWSWTTCAGLVGNDGDSGANDMGGCHLDLSTETFSRPSSAVPVGCHILSVSLSLFFYLSLFVYLSLFFSSSSSFLLLLLLLLLLLVLYLYLYLPPLSPVITLQLLLLLQWSSVSCKCWLLVDVGDPIGYIQVKRSLGWIPFYMGPTSTANRRSPIAAS